MTSYNWKKLGLIITPQTDKWWMQSHAMIPTLERLDETTCRIYFSGRDENNRSHISYADIDLREPTKALQFSETPVLGLGRLGCFDDNGVTPSCLINHDGKKYLYYIGWNPGSTVRMHLFGGLAISTDNGKTFERYSEAPIIERCKANPFLNTAPFVLREDSRWLMYYVSGTEWVHKDLPRYNIQIATSENGLDWKRDGRIAIDYKDSTENALARPFVIKDKDGLYKMWFSYKSTKYTLGYAESQEGINWTRMDNAVGIQPSEEGWDSDMIEYAAVTQYKNTKIMFYNGNNYGHGGIGVAIHDE